MTTVSAVALPVQACLAGTSRHALSAARLLAAAAFAAASAAHGQPESDAERCAGITNNPDLAIQYCTRAIDSKRLSGEPLAKAHYNRAIEWATKGVHDRAIEDYDAAIRLLPKFSDAYFNRGHAWSSKGDADRAIADYSAAIRLNPGDPAIHISRAAELLGKGDYARAAADYDTALKLDPGSAAAYLGRGRARFYSGDFERAASDIEHSLKIGHNGYTALWLYLARKRANTVNAEEMLDSETRADRGGWPGPIILLFMGRTDVDSVLAAAVDSNPRRQSDQRCEANFYLGHWNLLRGERERAIALLKEAQAGCSREFLELEGATAELRRLTAGAK